MAIGQFKKGETERKDQDALSALVRLLAVQAAREAIASHSETTRTDEDPDNEQQ